MGYIKYLNVVAVNVIPTAYQMADGHTDTPFRPLVYERVYLPLCKVADTPFRIQSGYLNTHPAVGKIQCILNLHLRRLHEPGV